MLTLHVVLREVVIIYNTGKLHAQLDYVFITDTGTDGDLSQMVGTADMTIKRIKQNLHPATRQQVPSLLAGPLELFTSWHLYLWV